MNSNIVHVLGERAFCRPLRSALQQATKKGELSFALYVMAEWTGLEPATPGVTGRYS